MLHKTIVPVANMGENMLFELLEAMIADKESLSAKVEKAESSTYTLVASVNAPKEKPMVIEMELVQKKQEESKDNAEVEIQYISFK